MLENNAESVNVMQMRRDFEEKIKSKKLRINSFLIENSEAYERLIVETENAKIKKCKKKKSIDYRRLKRYDVVCLGDSKILTTPLLGVEKERKFYVHNEQLFDIIHMAHLDTEHGGKHKLDKYVKSKYITITRETIMIYLYLCEICKHKRSQLKIKYKNVVCNEVNSLAHINLIDMKSNPDGEYKYILSYQEHLTKFLCLRLLVSNTPSEVAYKLIDIFCTMGSPSFLHSNNGKEFCRSVIKGLSVMWPILKVKHGNSKYDIEDNDTDTVVSWIRENNLTKWSEGLRFYQWKKNTTWHFVINQIPYEAMYGRKARIGMEPTTFNFLSEISDNRNDGNGLLNFGNDIIEDLHQLIPIHTIREIKMLSKSQEFNEGKGIVQNISECADDSSTINETPPVAFPITEKSSYKEIKSHLRKRRHSKLSSLNDVIEKLTNISERLLDIENEFSLFSKSVAVQLNNLPLDRALLCQEKIQKILNEERLRQHMKDQSTYNTPKIQHVESLSENFGSSSQMSVDAFISSQNFTSLDSSGKNSKNDIISHVKEEIIIKDEPEIDD